MEAVTTELEAADKPSQQEEKIVEPMEEKSAAPGPSSSPQPKQDTADEGAAKDQTTEAEPDIKTKTTNPQTINKTAINFF